MVSTKTEAIEALSLAFEASEAAEIIILYGSGAGDRLTRESDLDVAVAAEEGLSNEYCRDLALRLGSATGREVSVLDLAKLEGLILREILSRGQLLKNTNPNHLAQFIIKMYDYTEDVMPLQMAGIKTKLDGRLHG